MKWRLENTITNSSLSGVNQYINIKVPLGLACWMVCSAPFIDLPTKQDPSRAHVFHLDVLITLTQLYGAYLPTDKLYMHSKRLKWLYRLLSQSKKQNNTLALQIRALYQRCYVCSDKTYIPIDGPADEEQQQQVMQNLKCYDLSPADLISLYSMVDPNLKADAIKLSVNWTPSPTQYSVSWPDYGLNTRTIEVDTPICANTMRPFYHVNKTETWKDEFRRYYHSQVEKCISVDKCYIGFVEKYQKYPASVDEFIIYMYTHYCVNRCHMSLPAPIHQFAQEVMDAYAWHRIDPRDFIQITRSSARIEDRIRMEQMFVSAAAL